MRKGSTKGKRDKKSSNFGINQWNLESREKFTDAIDDTVDAMINEAIQIATTEYECSAWFSLAWEKPADPTTISVELPLGEEEFDGPAWSFTLSDLVDKMTELYEQGSLGGSIGGKDRRRFELLRDAFKELSKKVDDVLNRTDPK